jgi:hypothetical protein
VEYNFEAWQWKCHKSKAIFYAAWQPISVYEQIQGCNILESHKKKVQFTTLFSILCVGRPMLEFQSCLSLYKFISILDCPQMHWCLGFGWLMANHIYDFVKKIQTNLVQGTSFIILNADETSIVNNQSIIVIHVYVMSHWAHQSIMVAFQVKMESNGAILDGLSKVILSTLTMNFGLDFEAVASKLLCFGANGVEAFQGSKNGVTK